MRGFAGVALIGREIDRLARRRWFYTTRALLLVLAAIILGIAGLESSRYGQDMSYSARAQIGQSLFQTVHYLLLVSLCFCIPGVVGGAVAGERQQGTAEVLATLPLSSLTLLVGLAGGRLLVLVALSACLLPAMAACAAVGGVTSDDLWYSAIRATMLIVWLSSVCLLASVRAEDAAQAIKMGWLCVLLAGLMPALEALVRLALNEWLGWGVGEMPGFSFWVDSLVWVVLPSSETGFGPSTLEAVGIAVAVSLLCGMLAVRQLRKSLVRPIRQNVKSLPKSPGRIVRLQGWMRPWVRPQMPPQGDFIVWRDLLRARRKRFHLASQFCLLLLLGVLAVIVASPLSGLSWNERAAVAIFLTGCFMTVAVLTLIARIGPAIASEAKAKRLELLLVTPVGRRQLLLGQLYSACRLVAPYGAATMLFIVLGFVTRYVDGWALGLLILHLVCSTLAVAATTILAVGVSLWWSVRARNAVSALVVPMLILIGGAIGYPIAVQFLSIFWRGQDYDTITHLLLMHPYTGLAIAEELHHDFDLSEFIASVSGAAVCLGLGWLLAALAFKRFARTPTAFWLSAG